MKTHIRLLICLVFVLPCIAAARGAAHEAEILVAWNAQLLATAEAEDRFLTLKGVRAAAMMHLAVHDALNAIDPRFRSYAFEAEGRGADPLAAMSQAAFVVANDQYPAQHD